MINLFYSSLPEHKSSIFKIFVLILLMQNVSICCCCFLKLDVGDGLLSGIYKTADTFKDISGQLTNSLNTNVAEVGSTMKILSNNLTEIMKNNNIQFNSSHLENIGSAASEDMKDAIIELSNNWELAVNTTDLQEFAATAAESISKAIQNINVDAKLVVSVDPDTANTFTNTVLIILIFSGIAFIFSLIFKLIGLKQCQSYIKKRLILCNCVANSDDDLKETIAMHLTTLEDKSKTNSIPKAASPFETNTLGPTMYLEKTESMNESNINSCHHEKEFHSKLIADNKTFYPTWTLGKMKLIHDEEFESSNYF